MAGPEEVLQWVKNDRRRLLHVVYRFGDLDTTIKYDNAVLRLR
jgi:lactoylglutathione lyase